MPEKADSKYFTVFYHQMLKTAETGLFKKRKQTTPEEHVFILGWDMIRSKSSKLEAADDQFFNPSKPTPLLPVHNVCTF